MIRRVLLFALLALAFPAQADERWTFCVARDLDAGTVWLSAVFASNAEHAALEAAFKSYLQKFGPRRLAAQCPLAKADHADVVNDQFGAEQFNKESGVAVRQVAASEFPPRK